MCVLQYIERSDKMSDKKVSKKLIVIGASIGGPGIILQIVKELPKDTAAIVVVQHISQGFSGQMAELMDRQCKMHVKEAQDGEIIYDGNIYIAGFGKHLVIKKLGPCYTLHYQEGEREHGVCPSIDQLFTSAACVGNHVMGILLSGMGRDGAKGMLEMHRNGAYTVGQDMNTSVVYGMAREAKMMGGVTEELPMEKIKERISKFVNQGE